MKALVVGGTGPSGPYIVDGLLERGYEVTILHRGTHEVEFSGPVEHLHGDPHFVETLEETLGSRTFDLVVCTYGRLKLVAQVMKGRTPRFIAIGGSGHFRVLQNPPRGPVGIPVPIPAEAPLIDDPDVHHGHYMMAITEQAVMKIHNEGHYNATMFRYPMCYGPRQHSFWSIIKRIQDGRKQLILPDGGLTLQTRLYMENAAHAVLLGVDKHEESRGQIYNVTDEKVITIREQIELVSQVMNHEWEFISMPGRLARPSRPYASGLYHVVLDISKLKNELGYRDLVPLEEGIRRTVNWELANPPVPGEVGLRSTRDPFDYETEDRFIEEQKQAEARIMQIPMPERAPRHHAMPHPKTPGQLKDEMGR